MLLIEQGRLTYNYHPLDLTDMIYTVNLLNLMQEVVNDTRLAEFILNFEYKGSNSFAQTKDTNAEVYLKFYSGNERGNGNDYIWQANVNYYNGPYNIVGFTRHGETTINCNLHAVPISNDPVLIIKRFKNFVHEYCHLVGLTHTTGTWDFWSKRKWKYSAPYAIAEKAGDIAREKLDKGYYQWNA